jgi:hypothetical protein
VPSRQFLPKISSKLGGAVKHWLYPWISILDNPAATSSGLRPAETEEQVLQGEKKSARAVQRHPNMPLRLLPFIAFILHSESNEKLYQEKRALVPTPHFYMLYNGRRKLGSQTLHLSDSFRDQSGLPMLELVVKVIDIGYNSGNPILQACPSLNGYSRLIFEIERNMERGLPRDKAIKAAVDRCIEQEVLAEYLEKNYKEVLAMLTFEFNAEVAERVRREEAIEEGIEQGATLTNLLNKYLYANNLMDELKKSLDDREYQKSLIEKYNISIGECEA